MNNLFVVLKNSRKNETCNLYYITGLYCTMDIVLCAIIAG